jgi:aspartate carbamoyltransferase catalytic subunit
VRHLLKLSDLSPEELLSLLNFAKGIRRRPADYSSACAGKVLASLFFEPSTRTRLSFESAMLRMGGNVVGFADVSSSSAQKGESPEDTCRMVSIYSDIVAVRHPVAHTPEKMAAVSRIPVINAGDGANEHPTQTLADMFAIHDRFGAFGGLTVGICGDLKYGRTVHSLIAALAPFASTRFILISPPELAVPGEYLDGLDGRRLIFSPDLEKNLPELDVLYMTRIQKERFQDYAEYHRLSGRYILNKEKMRRAKKNMIVLHPLPRVDEISPDMDDDSRAWYFKQAEGAFFCRMALIMRLLGLEREI